MILVGGGKNFGQIFRIFKHDVSLFQWRPEYCNFWCNHTKGNLRLLAGLQKVDGELTGTNTPTPLVVVGLQDTDFPTALSRLQQQSRDSHGRSAMHLVMASLRTGQHGSMASRQHDLNPTWSYASVAGHCFEALTQSWTKQVLVWQASTKHDSSRLIALQTCRCWTEKHGSALVFPLAVLRCLPATSCMVLSYYLNCPPRYTMHHHAKWDWVYCLSAFCSELRWPWKRFEENSMATFEKVW